MKSLVETLQPKHPSPNRMGCLLMVFGLLFGQIATAEMSATNPPAKWLSLPEIKQKWADVPLDALQRAAEGGDLTAEHYLGYCYAEGFRFPQNSVLGVSYYERAGKAGYLPSWNNLGLLYQRGKGVKQDFVKALYYTRLAADSGLPQAEANLGYLYRDGIGVEHDSEEAVKWFRLAADQGQTGAMISLYSACWDGRGVASDHKEAVKWLTKAAEAGNAHAQCLLGHYYENLEWESSENQMRLPPNMPEAVRWYRSSADQNWAGGQYLLGLCYVAGNGVEQDEERGLELIRQAADQNHTDALFELASLYAKGVGEPRNAEDRPIALLQRVAASDPQENYYKIKMAYDSLIFRCEYGVGTERDIIAAVQWYCRGALAGMDGYTIEDKIKVADGKNDRFLTALSQYLKAASSENHDGLTQIGDRYLIGQDTPKNIVKAWLWFSLAAENGVPGARTKRSDAEARMTESEMKDAKQLLPGLVKEFDSVANALGGASGFQYHQTHTASP
jgi:TPR repeat protein